MYDAIQVAGYRCQGYDGWYYMRETSAGYENLKEIELVNGVTPRWKTTGTDNTVTGSTTMPGWNSPTVLAWRAPYTGTVTLTTRNNDNNAREDLWRSASHASGGTVTANILLNDTQVKQNDGTDAKWEF